MENHKNHRVSLAIEYVDNPQPKPDMVPFEFEILMQSVLGHYADGLPNEINNFTLTELKKLFSNYLHTFGRAFIVNHKSAGQFLIDSIKDCLDSANNRIQLSKSKIEICFIMIAVLGEINFKMLGGIPDNTPGGWPKPQIRNNDLLLNQYYSVHYSQDSSQKANLICDYVKLCMPELFEEIQQKRNSIKNDDKFIGWIKENEEYSKIYLNLF